MRLYRLLCLFLLTACCAFPYAKFQGYAEKGGTVVLTGGVSSVTKVQGSFPGATVTVRNGFDNSIATIFADQAGTAKANPFTADATGFWFFYADDGSSLNTNAPSCGITTCGTYSVTFSGAGVSSPYTWSGLYELSPDTVRKIVVGTGPVVTETNFPGADCGARINNAYAALPATGGEIIVPENCSYSTTIYFGTKGKGALLRCYPGGATTMTYTGGTGSGIILDYDTGEHPGAGVTGCSLIGPGNNTPTVGILMGLTNSDNGHGGPGPAGGGAAYSQIDRVYVSGFGTDLQEGPNTWMVNISHSTFRDAAHVVLFPDGGGSPTHPIGFNVGYQMLFDHVEFEGIVGVIPADCIRIHGGGTETIIRDSNINGCQIHLGSGTDNGSTLRMSGNHLENDNAGFIPGTPSYDYIVVDAAPGNLLSLHQNTFFQGLDSWGTQPEFILAQGGAVTLFDNADFVASGSTVNNFITANGTTNVTIFGLNNLNGVNNIAGGTSTGYFICWPGMDSGNSYTRNFSMGQGAASCPGGSLFTVGTTVEGPNTGSDINSTAQLVSATGIKIAGNQFTDMDRNTVVNNLTINGTCTGSGCGGGGSLTPPVIISGSLAGSSILTVSQGGIGSTVTVDQHGADYGLNLVGTTSIAINVSNSLGQLAVLSSGPTAALDVLSAVGGPAHRLTVLQNGRVGIGTSAPASLLDVNGQIDINGAALVDVSRNVTANNLTVSGTCTGCSGVTVPLVLTGTSTFPNLALRINDSGSGGPGISFNNGVSDTGYLVSGATAALAFVAGSGTIRMTLLQAGNLGIGTTAPADRLDIGGGGIRVGGAAFTDVSRNTFVNDLTVTGTCTGCASGAVTSFNTRVGAITLLAADVTSAVQDLTTSGTPTFSKVTGSRASGTAGSFSTSFTGSGTSLTLSLLLADPFTSSPGITFTGASGFLGSISAGSTFAFAYSGSSGTFLGGIRQTGIVNATAGFQVGGSTGVTSSTCSSFIGGICVAP